jgi:hypothetical protein
MTDITLPLRTAPPAHDSATELLAGPNSNPRCSRSLAEPCTSGRDFHELPVTNHESRPHHARHKVLGMDRRISLKTNDRDHASSTHYFEVRAYDIARPGASSLKLPEINRHTMQSNFTRKPLKTKKGDTNKVSHLLEGPCDISDCRARGEHRILLRRFPTGGAFRPLER